MRQKIKTLVNKSLSPLGIGITSVNGHDWSDVANFIPFEETVQSAKGAGLTVGDYVDSVLNGVPGSSQKTIDMMASLGVFSKPLGTVVEIGPGTGRYLEKTLKYTTPSRYEIYETAGPWSAYLVEEYDVVLQDTDGYSLAATADRNVSLVHAHKVFSTVPFIVTCAYWHEIARTIREGGWAVFDIVTERCLGGDAMQTWSDSGIRNGSFPAVMPRSVSIEFFERNGFELLDSFVLPMPPGTTELMVFKR